MIRSPDRKPSASDAALIAAVETESDSSPLVAALSLNPPPNHNARKLVHIRCRVRVGETRPVSTGKNTPEVPAHGLVKALDAIEDGESALAIAIRRGRCDLIAALMDAGADPNVPIEWRISRVDPKWEEIDLLVLNASGFWSQEYLFPSALMLALHSGPLQFNKPGAEIFFDNPARLDEVMELETIQPKFEVVRTLVENGASVTREALEASKKLSDPHFAEFLADELAKNPPAPSRQTITEWSDTVRNSLINGVPAFGAALPVSTNGAKAVNSMKVAVVDFSPNLVDEIAIKVGDRVWCALEFADGWLQVYNITTNALGFCPAACLADEGESSVGSQLPVLPRNWSARHLEVTLSTTTAVTATAAEDPPPEPASESVEVLAEPLPKKVILEAIKAMDEGETRLDLDSNELDSFDVSYLAEALTQNKTVTELFIHNNNMGDEGARALATALKKNNTISSLWINKNDVHVRGAKAISDALVTNTTLIELNIRENPIGDAGAQELGNMLKQNECLQTLRVAACGIHASGAAKIADALRENRSLTHLALYSNPIGNEGAMAIAKALTVNHTLDHLRLYGTETNISDDGVIALANILPANNGIRYLNLMKNDSISDLAVSYLQGSIKSNKTLRELYVRGSTNLVVE